MARPRPPVPPQGLRIKSLSLKDAARILSQAGGKPITAEMLQEDVAAGAPMNGDGTLDMVAYTAWLVREVAHGD